MNVNEFIRAAWAAVVDADIPEAVQPQALKEACEYLRLSEISPTSTDQPGSGLPPKVKSKAKAKGPAAKSQGAEGAPVQRSEAEFFSELSTESEVDEETLKHLFIFADGQLNLSPANSKLGGDSAERYRTVAVLMVPALRVLEGLETVPGPRVKELGGKRGASDPSSNFSKYVGSIPGYPYVGNRPKSFALRPGWETEFRKTVLRVLGREDDS